MKVDIIIFGLIVVEVEVKFFIVFMGIYVFKKLMLVKFLDDDYFEDNDFGGEIISKVSVDGVRV